MLSGIILFVTRPKSSRAREVFVELSVIINSAVVLMLLLNRPQESFEIVRFVGNLTLSLRIDGMSSVFAGLVAILWPFATLYAFGYMKKVGGENRFFAFYTMTFGVTVGIAFSANLLTMYLFYEMLTLITTPLVAHEMTKESIRVALKYLCYSIGGAALAFIGLVFIIMLGNTNDFIFGGVLDMTELASRKNLVLFTYVVAFCGFSAKAAMFPLHKWLPEASIAPTPVTALLHAVAVVNSGAFAIMRITYYSFGTSVISGTWAQAVVMVLTIITIIYGSAMAVKEQHLKRRLAYSTVANLSYVLFGAAVMTPLGFVGALTHMCFHGVMKICLFFCAGNIMEQTEKNYVFELDGLAKKMPVTFACFAVSGLALVGVPPLAGFISKWNLGTAALDSGNPLAAIGFGAILISAFLTAIYIITIVIRAYFVSPQPDDGAKYCDPKFSMTFPIAVFAAGSILCGVFSGPFVMVFERIAGGLF